jgi:molybdopterin synthase catalytic subunit
MRVRVRLFAILREQAGAEELELQLDDGATAGDAAKAIGNGHGLTEVLSRFPVALAVNREYATADRRLADGDEVALIPPISGGAAPTRESPRVQARLSSEPLAPRRVAEAVRRPAAGAIVVFEGTPRDVPSLLYEAYEEMAGRQITRILEQAVERHGLEAAAAEHRTGSVPLGQPSVVVAVSAAHREQAFAGAREVIDRIKAEAAIWKKEVGQRGSASWAAGTAPSGVE